MTIDWSSFSPWSSLAGGLLVGFASAMLILFNGRIAGISGIVGGFFPPRKGDLGWRLLFVGGLLSSPGLYQIVSALPPVVIEAPALRLVGAGLLVGFGTRLASGCTSGHGVCGLSRGSLRSFTATALFMIAGFASVYLVRHVIGG